jgi:hypothetical protein
MTGGARARAPTEDFCRSFEALKGAVRRASARQLEWEAKVVAGVRAALEFAAAAPASAHALTIAARRQNPPGGHREEEVIAYFSALLGEGAPRQSRAPVASEEGLVESIAIVVRGHLLSEATDQLPIRAPDLVYLTLMPYVGIAEARRWAEPLTGAKGTSKY